MARPLFAQGDEAYFRYALVVLALCYALVYAHIRGRPGRAWAMIRRGEVCAIACGVDIVGYKVWAFTLAGFLAGIAGGLLAGGVGQLDGSAFPASQSIMVFALTIVGGAYSWFGPDHRRPVAARASRRCSTISMSTATSRRWCSAPACCTR